jgi:hypothetical protein
MEFTKIMRGAFHDAGFVSRSGHSRAAKVSARFAAVSTTGRRAP